MAEKQDVKNICHLIGFEIQSLDEFRIDEDFRIRKLLPEEIAILKENYSRFEGHYFVLRS